MAAQPRRNSVSNIQHDFVAAHYAPRAAAYMDSAVHSGEAGARVLDLGCGGGHVSYRVAPHVREVVACDLTPDMLALVKRTADERDLNNISV